MKKSSKINNLKFTGMVVLTGNAHPTLSQLVCERMGIRMGDAVVYNKSNRETNVDIKQVQI